MTHFEIESKYNSKTVFQTSFNITFNCFSIQITMAFNFILLILISFISSTFCGNVGVGFSTSAPYAVPLGKMRANNVFILKNWDITPDLLAQMETTYAQVYHLKLHSKSFA